MILCGCFMITNAHLHLNNSYSPDDFKKQMVCFCAGSETEWETVTAFVRDLARDTCSLVSVGVHPWSLESGSQSQLAWLERLLQRCSNEVAAIGECGIDLYTQGLKGVLPLQLAVFEAQIELALRYEKPLVIHCRRSVQYFFKYAPRLKKLRSVIFHAYPGTLAECESLLNRGINSYFSFGGSFLQKGETRQNGELPESAAVLIRGGKKAVECVTRLPDDRLLLETDAAESAAELLPAVFRAAAKLRGGSVSELEVVCGENFRRAYGL